MKDIDYYYKGYDFESNDKMEYLRYGLNNDYGYNLGSTARKKEADLTKSMMHISRGIKKTIK